MLRRALAVLVLASLAATTTANANTRPGLARSAADRANINRVADLIREQFAATPPVDSRTLPKTPPYTHARVAVVPSASQAKVAAYLGVMSEELGSDTAVRTLRSAFSVRTLDDRTLRGYVASVRRVLTGPATVAAATEKYRRLPASFSANLLFDAAGHANIAALVPLLTGPHDMRGWWEILDVVIAGAGLVCAVVEPCGLVGGVIIGTAALISATIHLIGSYAESYAGQIACDEGTYMYPYPDWHSGNDYAEAWMQCGQSWSTTLQEVQVKMSDGSTPSDVEQFPSYTRYSFASVLFVVPLLGCATAYGEGLWTHDGDPVGFGAYGYNQSGPYCYNKD
jgi:hypothetical protein